MARFLATSVVFRILFLGLAFSLSDSGLADCVGCGGQRTRVIQSGPVFMGNSSPCGGNRSCGGFSAMPSPCGGSRPCGQSFSVSRPSSCGNGGNCGQVQASSPCGRGGCGGVQSSGGGGCRYGENQNVMICSDGVLDRGADNVFRPRVGGAAAPSGQGATSGNVGDLQAAPALGLKGPASHADSGAVGAPQARSPGSSAPSTARSENPAATQTRKIPVLEDTPFFRFAFESDPPSDIGRCSATGAVVNGVDLSGFGPAPTAEGWCVSVTAKHCIKDALGELGQKVLDGERPPLCSGETTKGFRTKIHSSLPGAESMDAIVLYPKGPGDVTLMAIPCTSRLKKFPLTATQSPAEVTTYLPKTFGLKAGPVKHTRTQQVVTGRNQNGPITQFTSSPAAGLFMFPGGTRPNPGDSGSPAFVKLADGKWYLAGALTGFDESNHTLIASGLTLDGTGPDATANLDRDAKKMLSKVTCDPIEGAAKPETEIAKSATELATADPLAASLAGFTAPAVGEASFADELAKDPVAYPPGTQVFLGSTKIDTDDPATARMGTPLDAKSIRSADVNLLDGTCYRSMCTIPVQEGKYLHVVKPPKVVKTAEQGTTAGPTAKPEAIPPPDTRPAAVVPVVQPDPVDLAGFNALVASSDKPVFLILTNKQTCPRCKDPTFSKNMDNYIAHHKDTIRFVVVDMQYANEKTGYTGIDQSYGAGGWPKGLFFPKGKTTPMTYSSIDGDPSVITLPKLVTPPKLVSQ